MQQEHVNILGEKNNSFFFKFILQVNEVINYKSEMPIFVLRGDFKDKFYKPASISFPIYFMKKICLVTFKFFLSPSIELCIQYKIFIWITH